MSEDGSGPPTGRARIGWWLFIVALGVVAAYVGYSFIGILLLGIFGYYATRPINRRLAAVIDSDERAAWATVVLVLLPLIAVLFSAGFRIFSQVQQALGDSDFAYGEPLATLPDEQRDMLQSALQNPTQLLSNPMDILQTVEPVASTIIGITFLVSLAVTLTAFLHTNDHALSAGLRHLFGGRDTTAYAYAATLDEDFASAFFGNFLFVLAMVVVSTLVYWGTNLLAPANLHVPLLFVLGFLTGVASLIPMVTGKLVFVPVVGYLAFQAIRSDGTSLVFVGVVLVV
jgi:predicted PurR-regulated permease PerM